MTKEYKLTKWLWLNIHSPCRCLESWYLHNRCQVASRCVSIPVCPGTEWPLGREPVDEVLHSEGWHQYVLDGEGLHWQGANRKALYWELVCSEGLALGSVGLTSQGSVVNLALKAVCSEGEPAVVRRCTASANAGRQFTLLVQNLLAQVNLYRCLGFFFWTRLPVTQTDLELCI